jgi:hypothetical protein
MANSTSGASSGQLLQRSLETEQISSAIVQFTHWIFLVVFCRCGNEKMSEEPCTVSILVQKAFLKRVVRSKTSAAGDRGRRSRGKDYQQPLQ